MIRYSRWPTALDKLAGPLSISAEAIASRRNYRLQLLSQPTKPANGELVLYQTEDPAHHVACMICRECGSELQFEFQVLPQILYYLGVDRHTKIVRPQEKPQLIDSTSTTAAVGNVSSPSAPAKLFHNSTEEVIST